MLAVKHTPGKGGLTASTSNPLGVGPDHGPGVPTNGFEFRSDTIRSKEQLRSQL